MVDKISVGQMVFDLEELRKLDNNASFKRISFKQNGDMSKLACLSLGNGK